MLPILKVNAVAGSGKTTTLLEFAVHRPDSRILYLAYNRSMAEEVRPKAKARSLRNLTVNTIHGLAYRNAGRNTISSRWWDDFATRSDLAKLLNSDQDEVSPGQAQGGDQCLLRGRYSGEEVDSASAVLIEID